MTRGEIQKYADELAQQYFPDKNNIWARENIEAIFVSQASMRMAEYVKNKMLGKACEWLSKALDNFRIGTHRVDFVDKLKFIESFKKVMEE